MRFYREGKLGKHSAEPAAGEAVTSNRGESGGATNNVIGTILTILAIAVCIGLSPFLWKESLEPVGAYITGFGQIIAVIWLILTFKAQSEDVSLQRAELRLQRKALQDTAINMQQSLAIEIYSYQKRHIDVLAKGILRASIPDVEIFEAISGLYTSGHHDAFLEMLCTSEEAQLAIHNKLMSGERLTYIQIQEFVERYDEMALAISRVDKYLLLKPALLSESPAQEFRNLANSMLNSYHELASI